MHNFIQHCCCDLGSHFEALESVLLIFFLGFASKKYDQTDSRAPKCLPRVTKTVMYIVNTVPITVKADYVIKKTTRCTIMAYVYNG
jgi:hypothetical protein